MNFPEKQNNLKPGLLVEVELECLPCIMKHPNFACGLIRQGDPDAGAMLKILHTTNSCAMLHVSDVRQLAGASHPNKKTDEIFDSLLLDPVDFDKLDLSHAQGIGAEIATIPEIAVMAETRHQAIKLAEQGVDLVVFTQQQEEVVFTQQQQQEKKLSGPVSETGYKREKVNAQNSGSSTKKDTAPKNTVLEQARWWLELIEIPCAIDLREAKVLPAAEQAPADFWLVNHQQIVNHDLIKLQDLNLIL